MTRHEVLGLAAVVAILAAPPIYSAWSDDGHSPADSAGSAPATGMVERMKKMHEGHEHAHDFDVIDHVPPEEMARMMAAMTDIGLGLPPMDSAHGREVFLEKGCIVCHQVNGIGGQIGPAFDAETMPQPMNVMEFAARMLRGTPAMVPMQQDLLGEAIELTAQELTDLTAFAHDGSAQRTLTVEHIPERYRELIEN